MRNTTQFEVLTWHPNSPDLNPIEHLWDVLDKQSIHAIHGSISSQLTGLQTSLCQIPQHTFRGLMESMPRWVRAVLAAKVGQHNIRQVVIMLCLIGVCFTVYLK